MNAIGTSVEHRALPLVSDSVVPRNAVATTNPCKLCTPLGATLAFRGVRGAIPILHGSQGCATYIRRYVISHFREPMDIASSSFSEEAAVFGGGKNLSVGLDNVIRQYQPEVVGIATTCLAETIGDDVSMILKQYRAARTETPLPALVHVSTPAYTGTHSDGFRDAVRALVEQLSEGGPVQSHVNLFAGMISPVDLRALNELCDDFGLSHVLAPDYSETLDGVAWQDYQVMPEGGTSLDELRSTGRACASVQLGFVGATSASPAQALEKRWGVPFHTMGLPIGVDATDRLMTVLSELAGKPVPMRYQKARGRLVDAYVDAHKVLFGKRALVFGDVDTVVGLTGFLREIGVHPVLCATGASGLVALKHELGVDLADGPVLLSEDTDFRQMEEVAKPLQVDFIIGHSKGYKLARSLDVPLVRVGFPIHDRFGGARIESLLYRGSQILFDRIVNSILSKVQDGNPIGYTYF